MHFSSENWTNFRARPLTIEVDFHKREPREIAYHEAMAHVREEALEALKKAWKIGLKFVLFTHGSSTSGRGRQTARSEVRKLMRDKSVTAYILRSDCTQHPNCFLAAVRENPNATRPTLACPDCGSTDVQPRSWAGYFRCRDFGHEFNWFDIAVSKGRLNNNTG